MIYFYLIVTIIAAALLVTDVALRQMENIKGFGIERKFFEFKGKTIPVEKFFPHTLTMFLACFLSFGISGMIFRHINFEWYFSLPFAAITAMFICFCLQYFLKEAVVKHKNETVPTGDTAAGVQGFAFEDIDGDDYGLIEFEYKDLIFHAPAVSVNGTSIPRFEKVIILFEQEGCFFVQSIKEVYEALNESED
ncbi:MAG: hypothetical protein FWD48_04465 [Oscillospiraceae bacterium]|nr:hypothetical protein [Oscillospiraceae bacterium]